jgi:hypothetical protein
MSALERWLTLRPFSAFGHLATPATTATPKPLGADSVASVAVRAYQLSDFGPAGDTAEAWRHWYVEAVERRAKLGRRTRAEALSLAYGELLNEWHRRHGQRCPPSHCAGCDVPIEVGAVLALPDGAAVHGEPLDCLVSYGQRWRQVAADGLARLGIMPPLESEARR